MTKRDNLILNRLFQLSIPYTYTQLVKDRTSAPWERSAVHELVTQIEKELEDGKA